MDEREFVERAQTMERRLYRTCATLLCSDADCADAVQETLIRAWRGIGALRQEQYFETWLTRIAINECRKLLRRRKSTAQLDERMPASTGCPPDGALREALNALDERLRLVVLLHFVNGFTLEETAHILRVPAGTVKSRLHRARQQLRRSLYEEDGV